MSQSSYERDLDRNAANFQPLTPLTFLERAAAVFPDRLAIAHGSLKRNYSDFHARSKKLASALAKRGIDTVAVMLANTPAMLECHYGVPMCGAVLNTLNTRLDAAALAFMLDHGEAKALFVDREFSGVMALALKLAKVRPLIVDYDDPEYDGAGERIGAVEYEALLAEGDESYQRTVPIDELDAISLNYTSGTTGDPKGVVYHHRGANLLAVGNVVTADMGRHPWRRPSTQFDAEQVAHLAIEIGEIGLGPAAHADLDVTLLGEPLGENPQGDRLAGAGSPGDEGEAAFADQLLDAPAERRDARRDMKRLHRHVGRKRIPFEAVEREHLLVHVSSPCSSFGR